VAQNRIWSWGHPAVIVVRLPKRLLVPDATPIALVARSPRKHQRLVQANDTREKAPDNPALV